MCLRVDCGVSITTAKKSDAVTKLIQRTCKATSHTQACYHYYSAIQNYDNIKSTFTCSDFNGLNPANGKLERPKLKATLSWKAQHTSEVWWDYTQPLYNFKNDPRSVTEPDCQADEYPQHTSWRRTRTMCSSVNLSDGFPAVRTEVRQVCGKDSAPIMTVEMAIFRPTSKTRKQKT